MEERRKKMKTIKKTALHLKKRFAPPSRKSSGKKAKIHKTSKVIITISGAPARNCIERKIEAKIISFVLLFSQYFKKYIKVRGNHGTEKRWGRRLWTDNRYPDNIKTTPPTNEAIDDAFKCLKKRYVVKPAKTK